MPVVTDTNVVQLQGAVSQQWDALRACFDAGQLQGKAPASGPLSAQETALNSRVLAYLAMTPSFLGAGAQMDQGQALQRDLNAWGQQLKSAGFANVPTAADVPGAQADIFGSIGGILQLVVVVMLLNAAGGLTGRR